MFGPFTISNPAPFYPFSFREALLDWKFGCFTVLYRFLYGINIKSNNFVVVVEQDWLRTEFQARYGVRRVVVAHPIDRPSSHSEIRGLRKPQRTVSVFLSRLPADLQEHGTDIGGRAQPRRQRF